MMQKAAIREALQNASAGDQVTIGRDGVIAVRQYYYYRMGRSAEQLAARVREAFPDATILEASDHWHTWPRLSYWQVCCRLPLND